MKHSQIGMVAPVLFSAAEKSEIEISPAPLTTLKRLLSKKISQCVLLSFHGNLEYSLANNCLEVLGIEIDTSDLKEQWGCTGMVEYSYTINGYSLHRYECVFQFESQEGGLDGFLYLRSYRCCV